MQPRQQYQRGTASIDEQLRHVGHRQLRSAENECRPVAQSMDHSAGKTIRLLNMSSGKKIQLPFDQLVIFTTNLEPKDLVDDAFLRLSPYNADSRVFSSRYVGCLRSEVPFAVHVDYRRTLDTFDWSGCRHCCDIFGRRRFPLCRSVRESRSGTPSCLDRF